MDRPTTLSMSRMMEPALANFFGNIHGGHLMHFFDNVAYACAAQYAAMPVITLSVDDVYFKEPIHIGDLVTCHATVNYVGRTSMEIGLHVVAKNLITGEERHTNSCYVSLVTLDDNGKPTPCPQLEPKTDEEKRRFKEGKQRKEERLARYQAKHGKK